MSQREAEKYVFLMGYLPVVSMLSITPNMLNLQASVYTKTSPDGKSRFFGSLAGRVLHSISARCILSPILLREEVDGSSPRLCEELIL